MRLPRPLARTRLRATVLMLFGAALAAWADCGRAKPSCDVDPTQHKVYRLELTVPATYCRQARDEADCQVFPKRTPLQLHGLWPNYESGYPEGSCPYPECREQAPAAGRYCAYPDLPEVYKAEWWPELKTYMAGTDKCLERHEWVKHGTCSPMDSAAYFHWSLETTQRIATALAPLADQPLTRARFNDFVRARLPEFAGTLRLGCKGRAVSSVYVLYEWGNRPQQPIRTQDPGNHFGNCREPFVLPSRP